MERMEKVEKLRERANVSYEEAKAALEANEWDLLDAMVALEKAGKATAPKQQKYSTSYDQQDDYIPVKKKVEEQEKSQPHLRSSIGEAFRNFIRICRDNTFRITHKSNEIVRLPLLAAVLILLFTWKISVPVMIVALLFGIRYSFDGKDDLKKANAFMESAGNAAESLKEGFMKSAGTRANTETASVNNEAAGSVNTENVSDHNSTEDNTNTENVSVNVLTDNTFGENE